MARKKPHEGDETRIVDHFMGRLDILPIGTKVRYVRTTASNISEDLFIGSVGFIVDYVDRTWKESMVYRWKCYPKEILSEVLYVVKMPNGWSIAARRCELEVVSDSRDDG
ncbi:MAG: hypothetical protein OH337_04065 [Candidatus Parvarchaeota archaeon]|nr:hypothetical protein [Candidatus Haiyanarchaeum thermophilum]